MSLHNTLILRQGSCWYHKAVRECVLHSVVHIFVYVFLPDSVFASQGDSMVNFISIVVSK